jgi:chromosomal replication initiator protein
MELTASELWTGVLEAARSSVPAQSFTTWLSATHAVTLTETELIVEAPTSFHVDWVSERYGPLLRGLAESEFGLDIRLAFRAAPESDTVPLPREHQHGEAAPPVTSMRDVSVGRNQEQIALNLNRRYTFDRFVVGDNSQLAAAACRAVAESPARSYNPLFLYGGVGLGKTHLMHAIGNHMLQAGTGRRVAYITSEEFTNDLVGSIRSSSMDDFRHRYRRVDLLLVDDVHFIGGKDRTQEEFFHTFNALYDARKQIVLASDRPPKELKGLEDRILSRFDWGLVADIRPPDYETRIAILQKKADDDDLVLDEDVIDFIARWCTSSVRELEGAIIKLLAYSSLTHQELTVSLAKNALRAGSRGADYRGEPTLSAESIRDRTAEVWGESGHSLTSPRRTKNLSVPRQVAMYLIREQLGLPFKHIGAVFGGRDHSTVMHSVQKVADELLTDPELRGRVDEVRRRLLRGS